MAGLETRDPINGDLTGRRRCKHPAVTHSVTPELCAKCPDPALIECAKEARHVTDADGCREPVADMAIAALAKVAATKEHRG
jgi:hypothetical protein